MDSAIFLLYPRAEISKRNDILETRVVARDIYSRKNIGFYGVLAKNTEIALSSRASVLHRDDSANLTCPSACNFRLCFLVFLSRERERERVSILVVSERVVVRKRECVLHVLRQTSYCIYTFFRIVYTLKNTIRILTSSTFGNVICSCGSFGRYSHLSGAFRRRKRSTRKIGTETWSSGALPLRSRTTVLMHAQSYYNYWELQGHSGTVTCALHG